MDELIKTFHIDWRLLVAQLVNFGIVLFVLWKFAVKPLSRMMNNRTKEIEKSLEDAKKIEEDLVKSQKQREGKLTEARKEAQAIIQKAQTEGNKQGEEMVDRAKAEVTTIIAGAKEQIAQEKSKMMKEVKSEVVNLTMETTKKVLDKVVSKDIDEKFIKGSLKDKDLPFD
ncbi:F0F1 ATP synthase subunit B [Patescibacteria group bacterium]|nr:F0F1 ATP synthase subunit B [Patescibacteria group bacterium]